VCVGEPANKNEQRQVQNKYQQGRKNNSDDDKNALGNMELELANRYELSGKNQCHRGDAKDWK
jgi:hypothetical protein